MSSDELRDQVLRSAEALFCSRGVQAVGMDDIRAAAGVSLKRLYQLFPGKEPLVEACLRYRDARWWSQLTGYVEQYLEPRDQIMAIYDWIGLQIDDPEFRGCPWVNTYGELSVVAPRVADLVRTHKQGFRGYLSRLVDSAGLPHSLTERLLLLAEGYMVVAGIFGEADTAAAAKLAAAQLIDGAVDAHQHNHQTNPIAASTAGQLTSWPRGSPSAGSRREEGG